MNLFKLFNLTFVCFLFVTSSLNAASLKAKEIEPNKKIVVNGCFLENINADMDAESFLEMTPKKYQKMIGKKLSLKDKLFLKYAQRSLKRAKKKGGVQKSVFDLEEEKKSNLWIAFLLGFLLGPIGVLISLFMKGRPIGNAAWGWLLAMLLVSLFVL